MMTDSTWRSCEDREDLYQGKTTLDRGHHYHIIFYSYFIPTFQQLSDGGARAVHGPEHGGPGGAGDQGRGAGGHHAGAGGADGGTRRTGTEDK